MTYSEGVHNSPADTKDRLVRTGTKFRSSPSEVADGDNTYFNTDSRGYQMVVILNNGTGIDGESNTVGLIRDISGGKRQMATDNWLLGPDGLWDRFRGAGDTVGSGLGALLVSPAGHKHNNVAADEQVLGAAGKLHSITVNQVTTARVLTVYDSLTESGTVLATLSLPLTGGTDGPPFTLLFDVECATGLYLGFDASLVGNVTASVAI